MKRTNHSLPNTPTSSKELLKHIAFHEAGHVVAISLRNHQQKLPPVFFKSSLTKTSANTRPFLHKSLVAG
ncbi:hypothetical protein BMR05_10285 [Methylococcaceae bacterium HT4]|nr:hypothetical protein BMR05_10285 [Methylococcaceae bacterium HT4]TXL19040.1 hypothetical protein BMR06_11925 [Methylococcaceae bacterium HT5]TXL23072.1 hypothetical protein BMR03_04685 [Methylococcaceae bacterium HT2]